MNPQLPPRFRGGSAHSSRHILRADGLRSSAILLNACLILWTCTAVDTQRARDAIQSDNNRNRAHAHATRPSQRANLSDKHAHWRCGPCL